MLKAILQAAGRDLACPRVIVQECPSERHRRLIDVLATSDVLTSSDL